MSEQILKKAFQLTSSMEVSKHTVMVMDTGSTYRDGCTNPSAANVAPLGIADESILPNGLDDYIGGQYQITTGASWPANSRPSSSAGKGIALITDGIAYVRAYAAISKGDEVNIADVAGRVKTIDEVSGTFIYPVGIALDAAAAQDDVIRVKLTIGSRRKA